LSHPPAGLELQRVTDGIALWIHVTPRAARERVGGVHGGALRVAVREPPALGAANAACVRVLAAALAVPRGAIALAPGAKSRRKRVRLVGDPAILESALRRLAGMAGPGSVG
jgi:uncharacterized protein (TIGR00251 family)